MSLPALRCLAIVLTLVVALALAAGCGDDRSMSAYCHAYHSGFDKIKQRYPDVDQYRSTKDNPLVLLLRTTSAFGDIVALIGDMADAAPADVESDTQRVHDSLKKQLDLVGGTSGAAATGNWSSALGGLASSLMDSVVNAGAYQRMDEYIVDNCGGRHMFSVSPQS